MRAPNVELILNRESYLPGEQLIGVIQFEGSAPEEWDIEISVLWHTESNGKEDSGVILVQEWSSGNQPLDIKPQQLFCVRLPGTAVTCNAEFNQIRWMVRLKVRWAPDGEMCSETPFQVVLNDTCSTISQEETHECRGKLAHRLDTDFAGHLGVLLFGAIYCNGVLFIIFYMLFSVARKGEGLLFVIPLFIFVFVTVSLRLVFDFVAILMAGPIRFELSRQPLVVGTSCQYLVEQRGRFRIRDLQLKLRCTESTTRKYTRNTYVDSRVLFQQTVADAQDLGEYGLFGILCVPDDVKPSYEAGNAKDNEGNTKVEWELHLSGWVARYLPFSNSYPVIVRRAGSSENRTRWDISDPYGE